MVKGAHRGMAQGGWLMYMKENIRRGDITRNSLHFSICRPFTPSCKDYTRFRIVKDDMISTGRGRLGVR